MSRHTMHTTSPEVASHRFLLQTRHGEKAMGMAVFIFFPSSPFLFTCNSSLHPVIAVMVPLLQFMDVVIIHFLSLPASCSLFFFLFSLKKTNFFLTISPIHSYYTHRHIFYMHACILFYSFK